MTIKLRIISGEDEDFLRDVEISGKATFLDLHNFMQDILQFDEGQMASFFITDNEWQKNEEVTLMDMALDESGNSFVMSDTSLEMLISEKKQRLIYVFDFFSERSLFIEVYEIDPQVECTNPKCLKSKGNAPLQVDLSEVLGEGDAVHDKLDAKYENDVDELNDAYDLNDYSDTNFDTDSMITYSDNLDDL